MLNADTAVRMEPPNDLGDLVYPAGEVARTGDHHGRGARRPRGTGHSTRYKTDTLSADVLVGSGDSRKYKPARVEVAGKLEGWDVSVQRVGEGSQEAGGGDSVIITLHRSKAPLIFDLGICLVLFALAALALAVVIPMATGKRKLVPPFGEVVRRAAVRGHPHPQLPAGGSTAGCLDRPSTGDLGADRTRRGDGDIHARLVPKSD